MCTHLNRRSFLFAATTAAVSGSDTLRFVDTGDGKLAVFYQKRPLFEYRYDRARPKPYIHPLFLPNGDPVCQDSPKDHVHHRGLMVGWSAVDGFDFWGETNPGPHGQIVHQGFHNRLRNRKLEIVAINHWVADGKLRIVERRTIRTQPPLPEGIWLEWISELSAPNGVSLQTGGHVYDGLGIRFVPSMDGGEVLNEHGTNTIEKANGEESRWCTYSGALARAGETGGVALFDHPSNPRHPNPFFVMNKPFGYLSAAPTFRGGFEMKAGDRLTFRWGVLSYLGKPEAAAMNRLFAQWR